MFGETFLFGMQVYVAEVECDVALGTARNVHGRTEAELRRLSAGWEETPAHMHKLDLRGFLQEQDQVWKEYIAT